MVMRSRRMLPVVVVALVLVATAQLAATCPARASARVGSASSTWVPGDPLDCTTWRYGAGRRAGARCPTEFDRNDYKRTSLRDPDPALRDSPQNQCGQKGSAVDLAWGLSPRAARRCASRCSTRASSGATPARWPTWPPRPTSTSARPSRRAARRSPTATATTTASSTSPTSAPIPDLNGNGVADPEDLILDPAYNNGVDDDHDGYVDDISGWDFLYGDNDPLDTVDYGHGTGEAEDSTAAENGTGDVGTCPQCQFLPVRVGDSFIADGGRFAAGVLFGARLRAPTSSRRRSARISNPRQAQQAIDAAYHRGVVVVASMADEASKHPNLPGLARAHDGRQLGDREASNPLGGGTDRGLPRAQRLHELRRPHLRLDPVEHAARRRPPGSRPGMVGPGRELRPQPASPRPGAHGDPAQRAVGQRGHADRARTADDIDFSTPNAVDPANNFGTPTGSPLLDTVRYPTHAGLGRHRSATAGSTPTRC